MSHRDHADGCSTAVQVLYEYLDGELTEERRVEIIDHLEACSPCFDKFEFEVELRYVVANHCRTSVPDDLRRRIADEIGA